MKHCVSDTITAKILYKTNVSASPTELLTYDQSAAEEKLFPAVYKDKQFHAGIFQNHTGTLF